METLFIQADEWLERLTLEAWGDFTARGSEPLPGAARRLRPATDGAQGLPDAAELLGIALAQGAFRAGGAQRTWMA